MHEIQIPADAEAILALPYALVFKHSRSCPVSADALEEMSAFLKKHPELVASAHIVDVIARRPVSRHIASLTGVTHESPQVLVVREGRVAWHASHHGISERALELKALPKAALPS